MLGKEIGRTYTERKYETRTNIPELQQGQLLEETVERVVNPGTAWGNASNLRTSQTWTFFGEDRMLASVENPDGTMVIYSYANLSGNRTKATVKSGVPNGGKTDIINGTRVETIENELGAVESENSFDIATNIILSSMVASDPDAEGRFQRFDYLDGSFEEKNYGCCGLESMRTRDGVTTSYMYDEEKRLIAETSNGITISYEYDAAGRRTKTSRTGTDSSVIVQQILEYGVADRILGSKDAGNHETTFSDTVDSGTGGRTLTTNHPDGGTEIESIARDGDVIEISGTAARPKIFEESVEEEEEGVDRLCRKTIHVGSGGAETEWVKEYRDAIGRVYKVKYPDNATSTVEYNSKGQMNKQVDPDGVVVLFEYNALGEVETTAIDMNQDGDIDLAGPDRVTKTFRQVTRSNGEDIIRETTQRLNAGQPAIVQTRETAANGLKTLIINDGVSSKVEKEYQAEGYIPKSTLRMDRGSKQPWRMGANKP